MKPVAAILGQIQWQVQGRDQFLFQFPRLFAQEPCHPGVFFHPFGESGFAGRERHPFATTHAAQVDPQFVRQEASESKAKGRSLGIAGKMVSDPMLERLRTWRFAVPRWCGRRNAYVKQAEAVSL